MVTINIAECCYRRAEARLAKYGSETSKGANLLMRQTNLLMTRGGGTRSRPVRATREETPARRTGSAGPAILQGAAVMPSSVAAESFPVDVDPAQIVRWVLAEHKAAPSSLRTAARRVTEDREIARRQEYHLDDSDREDLSEVATIATLEIAPPHESDGWILTVTVEDEIGPRTEGNGANAAPERNIDIGTFYNEFIRPGRGSATVIAEVASPAGRRKLTRLLEAIERNERV
jgi:hypothetical protein